MHTAIVTKFRRYQIFGFTGTPRFKENAHSGRKKSPQKITEKRGTPITTTEALFGKRLHLYTISNAIADNNVLPFKVDYVSTVQAADHIKSTKVPGIDTERALLAPARIKNIVGYILEHFDQKTRRNRSYRNADGHRLYGFNSLFATASIEAAKCYYTEFACQQASLPEAKRLKIGIIYSYAPNEGVGDANGLDPSSRNFLESAIADYNKIFNTTYDTSGEKFFNYYTNIARRLKNRELDMAIVVDMFLTGFDAKTLNTLWLDKNLKMHGLIQAFSRTNRIFNAVKIFGNIVTFRDLEEEKKKALFLFGNGQGGSIALVKPYAEQYKKYQEDIANLLDKFPLALFPIASESEQKKFIQCFNKILRLLNYLTTCDEFKDHELLDDADYQDYRTHYQDIYRDLHERTQGGKEDIEDDLVFEIELIKQVEVNVDYILLLIEYYLQVEGTEDGENRRKDIWRNIGASPTLRDKKDLIENFVETVSPTADVRTQWGRIYCAKESAGAGTIDSGRAAQWQSRSQHDAKRLA